MRIVHLVPNLNFGGLQAAATRLSLWLREQGHEVTVTYWLGPNANQGAERELTEAGVEVLGFRDDTVGRLASVRRLMAILKRKRCDILHVHNPFPYYFYGALAARLAGVPVVMESVQATAMFPRETWSERQMVWLAMLMSTRVISVSEETQAEVRARFWLPDGRHAVVENSSDLPPFLAVPPRRPRAEVVFGLVARMVKIKNHAVLLDAFARLAARHPEVRLRFLGSGPLEDKLRRQATALGLDPIVTFSGFTREVPAFLAGLDVFVLPSTSEGLPLSLVEAIASGLPVVATTVGGTTRVVEGTDSGWLCAPDDVDGLVQALEAALAAPDRIARGERARQAVAVRYAVPRMAAEYEALYQSALGAHRH